MSSGKSSDFPPPLPGGRRSALGGPFGPAGRGSEGVLSPPPANAGTPGAVQRNVMSRTPFRRLPLALVALAAALFAILAALPAAAAGKLAEETAPVPRETRVPLALAFGKSTIFGLESQNDPKPEDVAEAKEKDPEDRTWVLLRLFYRNDGYTKQKVKVRVLLLDEAGGVLADTGRSTKLKKMTTEDTLSIPMKVKTLDWAKAAQVKVLATFLD